VKLDVYAPSGRDIYGIPWIKPIGLGGKERECELVSARHKATKRSIVDPAHLESHLAYTVSQRVEIVTLPALSRLLSEMQHDHV
jgi:hypothetical protein